jgi:hypothetical protein
MTDRFSTIYVKVTRANYHLDELEAGIHRFLASDPYKVVKKPDVQAEKHRYEIESITPIPIEIPAIFGDVIQNLRSALDHLTNQLCARHAGQVSVDEEFNFPIFNNVARHQATFRQNSKIRCDPEAWKALERIQSYKNGEGHRFWVLNRLNNIDKHRLVLTVGSAHTSTNWGEPFRQYSQDMVDKLPEKYRHTFRKPDIYKPVEEVRCPLKVGDVLIGGLPAKTQFEPERDFKFDILINEPNLFPKEPLVAIAKVFHSLVHDTIVDFRRFLD